MLEMMRVALRRVGRPLAFVLCWFQSRPKEDTPARASLVPTSSACPLCVCVCSVKATVKQLEGM